MRTISFLAVVNLFFASTANSEVSLPSRSEVENQSEYCRQVSSLSEDQACYGLFYCSDGGCTPGLFGAIIDPAKAHIVRAELAQLPVTSFSMCSNRDDFPWLENDVRWRAETKGPIPEGLVAYCGEAVHGYENDIVISLRQNEDLIYFSTRFGDEAGSPPTFISISEDRFYTLRGKGMSKLVSVVSESFDVIVGRPCETSPEISCSISIGNGRIVVDVMAPSSGMSGRSGYWEKSHWEIYPNQISTDEYAITVDLPVTSIRRWPATGPKPDGGFTSVDYDEGFETLRSFLAQKISQQVGGQVEYSE